MLRYFRSARAPVSSSVSSLSSLWSRRSYRSRLAAAQAAAAAAGTGQPVVYHVKMKQMQRLARNAVIALGAFYVTKTLVFFVLRQSPLFSGDDDDESGIMPTYRNSGGQPESKGGKSPKDGRGGAGHDGDEDEDDEYYDEDDEDIDPNSVFIPLPWTFQVVESPPYRGTDPEWQTYIRIAKDRELLIKIRDEMLEITKKLSASNPVLVQRIGSNLRVRKHWLEFDFPQRPPPMVVRKGLLYSPGSIALVTSQVDTALSMQIERMLEPKAFVVSAYAFAKTLLHEQAASVARYFGWSGDGLSKYPTSPSGMILRLPNMGGDSAAAAESTSKISAAIDPNASQYEEFKKMILYDQMRPGVQAAMANFKKKWAEANQGIRSPPPRGCVGVSGLVELQSQYARIVLNVVAYWDPKTKQYDGPSMLVKLQRIQPLTRQPL